MSSRPSLEQEVSDLASNIAPLIILALFVLLSLVWVFWFPWRPNPLYSSLHHFLTIFPLILLALLTYVAKTKLDEGEEEQAEETSDRRPSRHSHIPRLTTAEGVYTYLIALMLAFAAAIGVLLVIAFVL